EPIDERVVDGRGGIPGQREPRETDAGAFKQFSGRAGRRRRPVAEINTERIVGVAAIVGHDDMILGRSPAARWPRARRKTRPNSTDKSRGLYGESTAFFVDER